MNSSLLALGEAYFQTTSFSVQLLQGDGSDRKIYRLALSTVQKQKKTVVGVCHNDQTENEDFFLLTNHLSTKGIPVPKILSIHSGRRCYLMEDLGENNLAVCIDRWREEGRLEKIVAAYQKILDWLPVIQQRGIDGLENFFSGRKMNAKAFAEDLTYFRRNFVERFGLSSLLTTEREKELETLRQRLANEKSNVFVYRDFQSRNFMWQRETPIFIDYQSAFTGPLYYDLASMLYASRSGLDELQRETLIRYYMSASGTNISEEAFMFSLYRFVFIRRLRSLGTYSYLSMEKGKKYFLKSIAPTLHELEFLLSEKIFLRDYPAMLDFFHLLQEKDAFYAT